MSGNPSKAMLVLWTTGRCNLQCKYCYASEIREKKDMSFDTARKAIDRLKGARLKIQFTGGEPLLNFPLIRQVCDYVRENDIQASFQLQTNGTLIDREMALELKRLGIGLGVSMDGAPDVNEKLRGKTDALLKGMNHLAQLGIKVNLNSVVTSQNADRLWELADVALYFGNVAGIGLDLLRNAGSAKVNSHEIQNATPSQLREALYSLHERCVTVSALAGKRIHVRSIREAHFRLQSEKYTCTKNYCYAAVGCSYVVLPNGDVYPCGSLIGDPGYYMGNVLGVDPVKAIALKHGEPADCGDCRYHSVCVGACPSRFLVNNDPKLDGSLDCVLRKTSFEIAETMA